LGVDVALEERDETSKEADQKGAESESSERPGDADEAYRFAVTEVDLEANGFGTIRYSK